METQVCPRRILVSNLPKEEAEERVLDKLDIHFSKKKNGGGEVEDKDMLHDSGTVVITFVDDNSKLTKFIQSDTSQCMMLEVFFFKLFVSICLQLPNDSPTNKIMM